MDALIHVLDPVRDDDLAPQRLRLMAGAERAQTLHQLLRLLFGQEAGCLDGVNDELQVSHGEQTVVQVVASTVFVQLNVGSPRGLTLVPRLKEVVQRVDVIIDGLDARRNVLRLQSGADLCGIQPMFGVSLFFQQSSEFKQLYLTSIGLKHTSAHLCVASLGV